MEDKKMEKKQMEAKKRWGKRYRTYMESRGKKQDVELELIYVGENSEGVEHS